jgi:NADH-quinone oxidoreductase subunit N
VSSDQDSTLFLALTAVAIASMIAGNVLALRQDNVKRILAYSSIAHLGYLLVAFLASGERAGVAIGFYLIAYQTTLALGVVTALSTVDRDADLMLDYCGLARGRGRHFAVALFLAGMPLTMGSSASSSSSRRPGRAGRWSSSSSRPARSASATTRG